MNVKFNRYCLLRVCICSLRYPACNTHAPYCHLWPVPSCTVFFYMLSGKGHNFPKTVIEHKKFILFLLQLLSEVFLILRRTERD